MAASRRSVGPAAAPAANLSDHQHPPDKGDVHAQAAVLAAALQAHENAVGDGGPLWVLHLTVDADLQRRCRRVGVSGKGGTCARPPMSPPRAEALPQRRLLPLEAPGSRCAAAGGALQAEGGLTCQLSSADLLARTLLSAAACSDRRSLSASGCAILPCCCPCRLESN